MNDSFTTDSKQPQPSPNSQPCFQLKGSMFTLTLLELYFYDYKHFNREMSLLVKQAPNFFNQTPIILCLDKLPPEADIDFIELTQLCQEYGLFPIAIRNGSEEQQLAALVAGLPKLPQNKPKIRNEAVTNSQNQNANTDSEQNTNLHESHNNNTNGNDEAQSTDLTEHSDTKIIGEEIPLTLHNPSKIITRPVRSGQQIYAAGGDLIILAPVSTGAEVLADGHIHIYASLRGRALAGVKGNMDARVFCQSLEPELISIAGHYKISDDLTNEHWGKAVQARLEGRQLVIDTLN